MKRARTNEQIVEEFFMRRRVDEPLDEEWKQVVESLRDKLIAELKTGRSGPAAQLSAAKLLELLTSRERGRPAHKLPTQKYAALAWIIDDTAALYAAQGHKDPLGAAYRDVKNAQSFLTEATVRDYHRKGSLKCGTQMPGLPLKSMRPLSSSTESGTVIR